jgi:hypothetical protein
MTQQFIVNVRFAKGGDMAGPPDILSSQETMPEAQTDASASGPVAPAPPAGAPVPHIRSKHRRRWRAVSGLAVLLLLGVYLIVAYVVIPAAWKMHGRRHPSLDQVPRITMTESKIPGDPLNVSLIGTETEVKQLMLAAKWFPADPITLKSCLEMTKASVLKREYDDAPVSSLYLFGRKQDLAFQQPVGNNPRKRNHVRFWRSDQTDPDGRPVWVGAATYDEKVGFGHETGQITHHIAPDIDTERDKLFSDLRQSGRLTEEYVEKFHTTLSGRNGGGDPWHTDGNMRVGVIAVSPTAAAAPTSQPDEGKEH